MPDDPKALLTAGAHFIAVVSRLTRYTPPLPIADHDLMRRLLTDALRVFADALGVRHDDGDVGVAAVPTIWWETRESRSGFLTLHLHAEVLLDAQPQDTPGESHISHLVTHVESEATAAMRALEIEYDDQRKAMHADYLVKLRALYAEQRREQGMDDDAPASG